MSNYKIMAGAANCSIDFPEKMFPTDGLKAVHDAPYMGVIILEAGVRAALVSMELVNVPDDAIEMAKEIINEKAGVPLENIWVHATHTITSPHAPGGPGGKGPGGPGGKGPGGPGGPGGSGGPGGKPQDPLAPMKRECFIESVRAAVTDCATRAAADLKEARIGIASGTCDVNVNRDIETPNGWWISLGGNGTSDKEMKVIRIERHDGTPVCFIVSYGVKPCAIDNSEMKTQNRLVSGDVPGFACRFAEEKLGAPCIYFTPAAADQVPREQAWYDKVDADGNIYTEDIGVEAGLEIVERLGSEMGNAIIETAAKAECNLEEGAVKISGGAIQADARGRASMPKEPHKSQEFTAERKQEVASGMITIGDIAFVSVKPEVCAQTGLELKAQSPFAHTILMSMVNGGMKYMPDQTSYDRVTWEAQNTMFLPGTAEQWVEMAVGVLKEMK